MIIDHIHDLLIDRILSILTLLQRLIICKKLTTKSLAYCHMYMRTRALKNKMMSRNFQPHLSSQDMEWFLKTVNHIKDDSTRFKNQRLINRLFLFLNHKMPKNVWLHQTNKKRSLLDIENHQIKVCKISTLMRSTQDKIEKGHQDPL